MMDQQTDEQAALYVLDLLEAEERRAFEARLVEDPRLRRHVRELGQALHQPLKSVQGPDRADLLPVILDRVTSSKTIPIEFKQTERRLPWTVVWAAAALLFLGLNLMLLVLMNRQADRFSAQLAQASNEEEGGPTAEGQATLATGQADRLALEATISRLQTSMEQVTRELEAAQARGRVMSASVEEARAVNAEWQREYTRLAARFTPFFGPNDGMSRFTVIEMVDALAYDEGHPRLGFNELAARFLSGEGNIAGIASGEPMGPFLDGYGVESATTDSLQAGLVPIASPDGAPVAFQNRGIAGPEAGSEATENASPQMAAPPADRPAGFTVWRDDEQNGFLDLYNLPDPRDGEQAFLWVRSSELEAYLPVGPLPELELGTGSVFYSVDEPNFTPSEILITSEPPDTPGSEPSGAILLRGP